MRPVTKVPTRFPAPSRSSRSSIPARSKPASASKGAKSSKKAHDDPSEQQDWMNAGEGLSHEELNRDAHENAAESFQQDSAADKHVDLEEKRDADAAHAEEEAKKEAKSGGMRTGGSRDAPPEPVKPIVAKKPDDGFETKLGQDQLKAAAAKMEKLAPTPAPAPPPKGGSLGTVIAALNDAQEAGVYFKAHERAGDAPENEEDRELAEAVLEAQRLLAEVRGVERIGPGQNEAADPVVLISVVRGFSQPSLELVPPAVHRFATLLAIPYDLLPLRRQ